MFPLFENHPFYSQPSANQSLWRYMDFVSLFALLDSQSLFFPSASTLQAVDPFEGSVSKATRANRTEMFLRMAEELKQGESEAAAAKIQGDFERFERTQSVQLKFANKWTFISCWHVNDGESAAMWKLYSTNAHSVAVSTTLASLRASLVFEDASKVIASNVKYLDYAQEAIPENFALTPFFHKRRSFEHEREFRIVSQHLPLVPNAGNENSFHLDQSLVAPPGIHVQANLRELIKCVFVSPDAPYWLHHLVHRLLEKYEVPCAMRPSMMIADVTY